MKKLGGTLFFAIHFFFFISTLQSLATQAPNTFTIGETFAGEELHYELDFWLFKGFAEVVLSFSKSNDKGRYLITLRGKTKGPLSYALRHREDFYTAVVEEIEDGKKLRTLYYEENIKIGSKIRRNIYIFDHAKSTWIEKSFKNGLQRKEKNSPIPPATDYNDFLTAAYNFRYGVYGSVTRGRNYYVPVFPRKGITHYEVKVAPHEFFRSPNERVFFVEVKVDPEIINSPHGVIEGYLSDGLYPIEGLIRDVVFFGDIRGRLTKRVKID
ncbi:MAG: DUF3108 domain-containing protein [Deltaproteobacteria bacterium]|nr:DUF3108 domain-containing protein [Deltaproteobacteria bacterium]